MHTSLAGRFFPVGISEILLASSVYDHWMMFIRSVIEPLVDRCASRHAHLLAIQADLILIMGGAHIYISSFVGQNKISNS